MWSSSSAMTERRAMRALRGLALALTVLWGTGAAAQDGRSFPNYKAMRTALDAALMEIDLVTAFDLMLPPQAVPAGAVLNAQQIFRDALPNGATDAAVLLRREGENGFAQEMIGYWSGSTYLYVSVIFHDRGPEDGLVVFTLNVQGTAGDILADF